MKVAGTRTRALRLERQAAAKRWAWALMCSRLMLTYSIGLLIGAYALRWWMP